MNTPESILSHESAYRAAAWQEYSIQELGNWVHLLCKRAEHRNDPVKREKDLYDAQNYLNMIQSHLDSLK